MPIAAISRKKAAAAVASLAVVLAMTAALIVGLRPHWQAAARSALIAFEMTPPSPSPTPSPPPPRLADSSPTGSPAPRNLHGKASPVFAPAVQQPLIVPPPIMTAPLPATGIAAQTGAANLAGPGTGAGGTGSGNGGGGTGGTGSGNPVQGPRQIRGKLSYADLPQGLVAPGTEAGVGLRYTVNVDGSASNCRVDRSSGFAALDAAACRLIEARFRFRPARDAQRRPVTSTVAEDHVWISAPEER